MTATKPTKAGKYSGEERRSNPRKDRPVLTAKERGGKDKAPTEGPLAGYAKTLDTWPANMLHPLTLPKRYSNNPRINDPAVPDVMASLAAFGAQQTIVVDREDEIVVGDTRFLAALALQWPKFPMQRFVGTKAEANAYRLADNKTGERAEWDFGRLAVEFDKLEEMGVPLGLSGFRDFEIAPIRASEWTPPSPGDPAHLGEGHERGHDGAHGDGDVIRFTPEQFKRVMAAVQKLGETEDTMGECVAIICDQYAP